jgi:hypothetical protein
MLRAYLTLSEDGNRGTHEMPFFFLCLPQNKPQHALTERWMPSEYTPSSALSIGIWGVIRALEDASIVFPTEPVGQSFGCSLRLPA